MHEVHDSLAVSPNPMAINNSVAWLLAETCVALVRTELNCTDSIAAGTALLTRREPLCGRGSPHL